jgi:hypothetical protein
MGCSLISFKSWSALRQTHRHAVHGAERHHGRHLRRVRRPYDSQRPAGELAASVGHISGQAGGQHMGIAQQRSRLPQKVSSGSVHRQIEVAWLFAIES